MRSLLTIKIDVTPKLLRQIADELEVKMKHARIGEFVPYHPFYSKCGETEVHLVADQEAFQQHGQSRWT